MRPTVSITAIRRIERDDAFFEMISSGWGEALKDAFNRLPPYTIAEGFRRSGRADSLLDRRLR
jgi:predicted proteasome-type protease